MTVIIGAHSGDVVTTSRIDPPAEIPLPMRRNGLDPAPELLSLHKDDGVVRIDGPFRAPTWLVTRYADVRAVLADTARFSNAAPLPGFAEANAEQSVAGNLLLSDPPDHHRLRRMLSGQFTLRRMRALAPRVEQIVEEHLDVMAQKGPPADLIADFALPVPSLVICELLGVPWDERDEFQRRSAEQMDLSRPEHERVAALQELHRYLSGLVVRARRSPADDLLGMLVREHGDELTDPELAGMALLLLVAGHETTANMIGLGTLALLRHPDQLAVVRDDPAATERAVEELLRWLSVVHTGVQRTATADVELAGVTIRAGDAVLVALPAANRDPGFIDHPDALDIGRGEAGHLAFGHGVHHCLGAPLARLELCAAFPALLRRFPSLALAVPDSEVEFRVFNSVYGAAALPVSWEIR
ncbi:cytochrome P450 [Amycolatopsis jiangsuensis]|uniref:Cytochrome P450 n=1 Tax=Amycolatopsis jiangsuensis TaxID=1181879 RepID=A0A840ISH6_9PSEU|nr:cytochrome P450 [Amycolatopsis jiangsuensis]MBB4684405.1 cytochrome P450 [Amycolatopsis jiangsuensis]